MKSYFTDTSLFIYGLSVIYFIVFYILLVGISKNIFKDRKRNFFIIFIIFALHYLSVLWDSLLNFMPFFNDTSLYVRLIENITLARSYVLPVKTFFLMSYLPKIFVLCQPLLFILFNIFVFLISILIYFKIYEKLTDNKISRIHENLIWIFILCLPSAYLYMSALLREALFLFSFSMFLYGLVLFKDNGKVLLLVVGLCLVFFIRYQFIIFILPITIITIFIRYAKKDSVNIFKILFISVLGILIFSLMLTHFGYKFNPQWLAYLRNSMILNRQPSVFTYGEVEWETYFDVFKSSFGLGAQFLLSPLPILKDFNPTQTFTIFLDSVYILTLLLFIFLDLKNNWIKFKFIYVFIVTYILIVGLYEFFLPGAARHRFPIVVLLVFLAGDAINNKFLKNYH